MLPSHFDGKIWPHSTQLGFGFFSAHYFILGHPVVLLRVCKIVNIEIKFLLLHLYWNQFMTLSKELLWPSRRISDLAPLLFQSTSKHSKSNHPKNHSKTIRKPSNTVVAPNHNIQRWLWHWEPPKKLYIRQNQALPCLIFKILQSRFKKLANLQKQALLCLIFKTWLSRFRKMFIRQNQTWPYIISKIWWSTFIEIPDKIRPGPFLFPKIDWVDYKRC